jgi:hypothetical protein
MYSQVEDKLFRLPGFYIAESPYFSQRLSEDPRDQTILMSDSDVTATGFSNLIYALHPQ